MNFQRTECPIGHVFIAADDKAVHVIGFEQNWDAKIQGVDGLQEQSNAIIDETTEQLQQYFDGKRETFDLPLKLQGTVFQQQAWQALQQIPFGETRSYSDQAEAINNPNAVRAIGHANSLNPISIVVPCHRVIAKSGKLAGYAGGVDTKQYLLEHERQCKA
ncbi:MAG: Methylated-DNA--protein-cysteine methyltransferase (EC [uncultured Thiotrichaceae bacterium]|uniref:Methylated-DNA--protein-cysteine methyltransferase n=1 Tax=uncultured Thiotrichaceae bacterium TaxID=298394 RepID=A0A6S6UCT3_9GAMM|nr:MAG: Methylated-DNA--protein-cysteine methyltransferase (EC [uncultured Thiotrichaceae bacterium]